MSLIISRNATLTSPLSLPTVRMSQLPECPLSLPCEQMSDFDIHVITPEVISKDPKVLLHKAGFDSDSTSERISQKVRGLICHFTDVSAFGG